jgi:hypothetical protein
MLASRLIICVSLLLWRQQPVRAHLRMHEAMKYMEVGAASMKVSWALLSERWTVV